MRAKINLANAHLVFGLLVFVAFAVTGGFMRADFPDKEAIAQEFRFLMRSRHIYILLSGLSHILLGIYLEAAPQTWRKISQIVGSFFLTAGSALLVGAFFYENYRLGHFSDLSRCGLYALLAGTAFHLLNRFRWNDETQKTICPLLERKIFARDCRRRRARANRF